VAYSHLFRRYSEPYHRARLLAAAAPHRGDWLHALPISACGLHLDDNAVRVAVSLRLGCAICKAHCCPCGVMVETIKQSSTPCLAQRLDSPLPDPGRNTSSQKAPWSQQTRRTRWLDVATMAVGAQCHVGCDSCSHTSNIRVAKCDTGRKCCSGRVCEKDDQVQHAVRHSHVFSERELKFRFAICYRPSVCRLSSILSVVCLSVCL